MAIAIVGQLPALLSATLLQLERILSTLVGAKPIPPLENFAVGQMLVRHRALALWLIRLMTRNFPTLLAAFLSRFSMTAVALRLPAAASKPRSLER